MLTGDVAVRTLHEVALDFARARARSEFRPLVGLTTSQTSEHIVPGCEHHDSTWMAGAVFGLAAALGVLTGIDADEVLTELTREAVE